jgi:lipopolysaccharide transport protein LptA
MCAVRWGIERSRRLRAPAAVLALLSLAGMPMTTHAADAPPFDYQSALESCHDEVCVSGSRLEWTPTHVTSPDVIIVYKARATVVKGDLAEVNFTSRDSKNSTSVITGHVQIFMPQGHLSADRATMQILNNRITALTAQGTPAEFERFADGTPPTGPQAAALEHAHGHAREITYDVDHNQLELNGDAYITAGCYEFSSEHMAYDIANQRVQADSSTHGKIVRNSSACSQGGEKP